MVKILIYLRVTESVLFDRAERHDLKSGFWLFFSHFLFFSKKRKKKRKINRKNRDFKSCLFAWSVLFKALKQCKIRSLTTWKQYFNSDNYFNNIVSCYTYFLQHYYIIKRYSNWFHTYKILKKYILNLVFIYLTAVLMYWKCLFLNNALIWKFSYFKWRI